MNIEVKYPHMPTELPPPYLPHERGEGDPQLTGMNDVRDILGSLEFLEGYAKLARANDDNELRIAKEGLEQRNREAVRSAKLRITEERALEITQRCRADLTSIDAAKKTLRKDWGLNCKRATEELTRENPVVDVAGEKVHFSDLETAILASRERENISVKMKIDGMERVALLKQKVARGEVERLLQSLERDMRYPPLQKAMQVWGQAPDALGNMGPERQGYHSGIVHYFSYRAYPNKYGRCRDWPMTVEGFVTLSQSLAAILERPRPEDNPVIDQSGIFTDEFGQRRLLVLTKDKTFINAFANAGEPLKVVTVIPDYLPARFARDLQEELQTNDEKKLNRLGNVRRRISL